MVRLNHCGFTAETTFYYVRINGSLYQEINRSNLFRFFLEYTDEFFSDDFSLLLRLCHSCKFLVESLLCVHPDKVQVIVTFRSEDCFYLISLVFTKKSMVYEYTGKLVSDCLGKHNCCHGRIHTAGKCTQYFSVAYFCTNLFD